MLLDTSGPRQEINMTNESVTIVLPGDIQVCIIGKSGECNKWRGGYSYTSDSNVFNFFLLKSSSLVEI